jgi:hypothetical protein
MMGIDIEVWEMGCAMAVDTFTVFASVSSNLDDAKADYQGGLVVGGVSDIGAKIERPDTWP